MSAQCRDGRSRRVEYGMVQLGHETQARSGAVRADLQLPGTVAELGTSLAQVEVKNL